MAAMESLTAERAVLGGLLNDNSAYWRIGGLVSAVDFSSAAHREIYDGAARRLDAGDTCDPITLSEVLDARGVEYGGAKYLAQMMTEDGFSVANIEAYAEIVRERARQREATRFAAEAIESIANGDMDVIPDLQSKLESLTQAAGEHGIQTFEDILSEGIAGMEEAARRRKDGVIGVPTGLPSIDNYTGGLHGPKLVVIAARPSVGKTALANQIGMHGASRGHPIGFIHLEMGGEEIAIRSMAYAYQLNATRLAKGIDSEMTKLKAAVVGHDIAKLPIFIEQQTFDLNAIISRLTEMRRRHGIELAVIDHLQLIQVKAANRNLEVSECTRRLKLTAKRLGIPIILISQLNRESEKENRKAKMSDLRDSGSIEQDADIVLSMYSPELVHDDEGRRQIELGFLKHRGGRVGWLPQSFTLFGQTQTIREMAR